MAQNNARFVAGHALWCAMGLQPLEQVEPGSNPRSQTARRNGVHLLQGAMQLFGLAITEIVVLRFSCESAEI